MSADFHRPDRSQRRDHGFARPNIALQQPQHRTRLGQISGNFIQHPLLSGSQNEGQALQKAPGQPAMPRQRRRNLLFHPLTQPTQTELVRQQFLKGQTSPGRMATAVQLR